MEAVYQILQAEAAAHLSAEGVPPERQKFQRLADLRYARQGFEVTVEFPGQTVTPLALQQLIAQFHQRHEQLYTYAALDTPVEIVNLRLRAVGQMAKLTLPRVPAVAPGSIPPALHTRPVYFAVAGWMDTPVFARQTLRAGHVLHGPAIIEQFDTTTVVFPGHEATVDAYGNVLIHLHRS
jgi:N-methylhydantoinase A/oxoprolinase/acetone carboxylase beta subunit